MSNRRCLRRAVWVRTLGLFLVLSPLVLTRDARAESYSHRLSQSTAALTLWTTPPAERVFLDSPVPAVTDSEVRAYAASNESEPFLIVARPATTGPVTVSISDFGAGITTEFHQVKYVNITTPSDNLGRTGNYPDPLWPLTLPTTVWMNAGQNTALWFTVHVPRGTPAGDFLATATVGGIAVPLRLHVFGFAVPDLLHVRSEMNIDFGAIMSAYGVSPGDELEYVEQINRFLIEHRLTPHAPTWPGALTYGGGAPAISYDCSGHLVDTDGAWGFDQPAAKYLGGAGFNNGTGFPSFRAAGPSYGSPAEDPRPATFCGQTRSEADWVSGNNLNTPYNLEWREYVTGLRNYLANLGYLDQAYWLVANEPQNQADYDGIAWYSQLLKLAAPDLALMASEEPRAEIYAHPSFTGAKIDAWLALFNNFDPVVSGDRDAVHGESTWLYFLGDTRTPRFNPITLDHPGVEAKLPGWLLWKYRVRGLAQYAMNVWWPDPWTTPYTGTQNGETFLLYPPSDPLGGGTTDRFVPSIRLELLRDGLEDYEYLVALAGGVPPQVGLSNPADPLVDLIVGGLTAYCRDSGYYQELRREIGLYLGGETPDFPSALPPARHPRAEGPSASYYINFQDPAGQPLDDPLIVDGKSYMKIGWEPYSTTRGYGWYGDFTQARYNYVDGPNPLQRSIIYDDYARIKTFEFDLPNGVYEVTVSVGWQGRTDLHNKIVIEGMPFIDDEASSPYLVRTLPVTVKDRTLTLEMGIDGEYTMLNYLDIASPQEVVADLEVAQTDAPDPQFEGEPINYHITVTNHGPASASATLSDVLPAGSILLGVTTSRGSCVPAAGVITCDLGELSADAQAQVDVSVAAPFGVGSATNVVSATGLAPSQDPEPSNNTASELTDVRPLALGDRVWLDTDGDGIQGAAETGVPGVIVLLYDGAGSLLGSSATDQDGRYSFNALEYAAMYSLQIVLPPGNVFAPQDRGMDDDADSDVDPGSGRTGNLSLVNFPDSSRWDAGLVPDRDRDGVTTPGGDCNDASPAVHPGAEEFCNGRDDDCDGLLDEGCDTRCDEPAEIGSELDLTPAAGNASGPKLAWTGSGYGMVYSDFRSGNNDIYFVRLDPGFNRLGDEVAVTNAPGNSAAPEITWTGADFGVVWQDDRNGDQEVYFARLSAVGAPLTGEIRVTSAAGLSQRPRIAWSGSEFGILWNDTRDGAPRNYFVAIDTAGSPLQPERAISPPALGSSSGRFAWNGSVYGVTYNSARAGVHQVWFLAIDRFGNGVTPESNVTTSTGSVRTPSIAWNGSASEFGIAWLDTRGGADQLFFTRLATNGVKLTDDHPLLNLTTTSPVPQALVHTGSEWGLVWVDQAVGNTEVYFGRLAGDALNGPSLRVSEDPANAQNPTLEWTGSGYTVAFVENRTGASAYHVYGARIGCCTLTTIGDRAWTDSDADGIQDAGEAGTPGVLIALYDDSSALVDSALTQVDGRYTFTRAVCGSSYSLRFFPAPSSFISPQDRGSDDTLDSDADPESGSTGLFTLRSTDDAARWDVGITPCRTPDEPVYIYNMTVTGDDNRYPVIHFQDPNQPTQITGYNVRRSPTAVPPPEDWPLVATDVIDMDEGAPNKQWVDQSGDSSPTGLWFYQVTAFNHGCPAEGPF